MTVELVEYLHNRFFIDLWHSCSFKCSYCYVDHEEVPERDIRRRIDRCLDNLTSNPSFKSGSTGPLLSISPHAESFNTRHRYSAMVSLIERLAKLGNPIQFATKTAFNFDQAAAIARCATWPGQIVAFTSLSTTSRWQELEAGTPPPTARFDSAQRLHMSGVHSCVYIKPVIPGITLPDKDQIAEGILSRGLPLVCVGVLYANIAITDRLRIEPKFNSASVVQMPGTTGTSLTHVPNKGEVDQLVEFFQQLPGVRAFRSSPCVVAWVHRTYSATSTWKRFPELCVQCQDCDSMYVRRSGFSGSL